MMPTVPFRTLLLFCLVCAFVLSAGTKAHMAASTGRGYSFVALVDSTGPIKTIEYPVISNTGVVAFGASVDDGGRAVFALQDGV